MPLITVAMSSYNHADYVGKTIQSVLSQKGVDLELCIVDDGSTDGTAEVIKTFSDPRLHVEVFTRNKGASIALSEAIKMGRGEFVAIINSDDQFLPGKLEKQLKFLEDNPHISACFGQPKFVDENELPVENQALKDLFQESNRSRYEWLNRFFFHGNCLCHPTVLIRRKCYEELGYLNPCLAQGPDMDFWIRLLLHHEIHVMDDELILFRLFSDHSNVSMDSRAFHRAQFEVTCSLSQYLKIPTLEDFGKIFPDFSIPSGATDRLIPFFVARMALDSAVWMGSSYKLFALQTLYHFLSDLQLAQEVEKVVGYSYRDFIKETRSTNVFYQKSIGITASLKKPINKLRSLLFSLRS